MMDFNDTSGSTPQNPDSERDALRTDLICRLESVLFALYPAGKVRKGKFLIGGDIEEKVQLIGLTKAGVLVAGNYTSKEMRAMNMADAVATAPLMPSGWLCVGRAVCSASRCTSFKLSNHQATGDTRIAEPFPKLL